MGLRARLVVVLLALVAVVAAWLVRETLPGAERGRRLAERQGCFGCHGPGGLAGAANAGRTEKTVPGFGGDVMMYAKDRDDLRAWIRDGVTPKRAASTSWQQARDAGALRMPAFGRRLRPAQIEDLVDFVMASAGWPEAEDSLALAGLARAEALGCTGCHGAGGRFALPNPGSFKGHVPPWDGDEFRELVRDRAEFDQWVRRGTSDRFLANPIARAFLHRSSVVMPAFERHLEPGDLDALWAYVQWMRAHPVRPPTLQR